MKVTAFFGSPRKDGNTWLLLQEALRGVEEGGHAVSLHGGGRVIESGPPAALAAGDGPFARLWSAWSAAQHPGSASP